MLTAAKTARIKVLTVRTRRYCCGSSITHSGNRTMSGVSNGYRASTNAGPVAADQPPPGSELFCCCGGALWPSDWALATPAPILRTVNAARIIFFIGRLHLSSGEVSGFDATLIWFVPIQ